jgi:YHS domain-containing protein
MRLACAVCFAVLLILPGCSKAPTDAPARTDLRTIKESRRIAPPTGNVAAIEVQPAVSDVPVVALPFAPAISMDPVDGGKIPITPDTPTLEHAGRIFYFRDEENRKIFLRNPAKYAGGQ